MIARGVENENSHVVTHVLRGGFDSDPALRKEFFDEVYRI
jgi:GTP cyclohydrolase I